MPDKAKHKVSVADTTDSIAIPIDGGGSVSGLFEISAKARAGFVLAHGAGAGMKHPFLADVSRGLAERQVSTLRYQFPYMEKGSGRPDAPPVAHAAVRAAVAKSASLIPELPLFAGGKSFGGRMTSQAQAASPLSGVRGLIFLGFPLHPPAQPSDQRGEHLFEVKIPMLFLQGDHDEFAHLPLLEALIARLGTRATLKLFPHANHSFHVPARSGRNDSEVMTQMLDVMKAWIEKVLAKSDPEGSL
jgi:hypothetical protein